MYPPYEDGSVVSCGPGCLEAPPAPNLPLADTNPRSNSRVSLSLFPDVVLLGSDGRCDMDVSVSAGAPGRLEPK